MGAFIVTAGWLLVWAAGATLVHAWRGTRSVGEPGGASWIAGTGFLVGAFCITLWMHLLSRAHVPFGVATLLLPLFGVLAGRAALAWRRGARPAHAMALIARACRAASGAGLPRGARVLWLALLAWLVVRHLLMWISVVDQPLYPWDAWIQWATKAKVWFEFRRIVPFVDIVRWVADASRSLYIDASPGYPGTIPLWQVYSCTLLGHWDDAVMNIPWWFVAVALAFTIYGYLRGAGFTALGALAGATLVATLPLANVHVALAGYADLPMAVYYAAAALATLRWTRRRTRFDAGVALVLAMACPLVKTPGIVWLLTLAVPLVALVPRFGTRLVLAGFGMTALALLVLAQTSPTVLNYQLHLDFAPPWSGLFDSLFLLGSWNLLWYGVVGAALLAGRRLLARELAPFTLLIIAGLVFLFIVFAFTNARAWVESQTTINRAVLHLAPLIAVWMMVVFRDRFPALAALPVLRTGAPTVPPGAAPDDVAVPALAATLPVDDPPGDGTLAAAALPVTAAPDPVIAPPAPLSAALGENTPMTAPPPDAPANLADLRLAARKAPPLDADKLWRALLADVPGDPEALFGLGNAASARGDAAAAAGHFEQALQGSPQHFGLLNNLGLAYEKLARLADAEDAFRRALAVRPDAAAPVANLAQNLFQQKRYDEAIVFFDRMAPHAITEPSFIANRGVCLAHVGRFDDSEVALTEALRLAPERTLLKRDLGLVHFKRQRWTAAAQVLAEVRAAMPADLTTASMLAVARANLADWRDPSLRTQLLAAIQGPVARAQAPIDPFGFLAWTDDPDVHLAAARNWMRLPVAAAPDRAMVAASRAAGAPLRVGFVSSDFTNHPVTRLVLGLVERLDPAQFTLQAYATRTHAESPLQARLRTRMAGWRDLSALGPAQQAAAVAADRIDVLIDLNGYTGRHMADLFALRPAPLQVNYLGYTGTLGSAAMDLIVADHYCIPAAERAHYSEAPLYVEPCYLPSDPAREWGSDTAAPARSDYGLPEGATVLAAFASTYKITPDMFALWMRVLRGAPDAVLWLRSGEGDCDGNLRAAATAHGIDATRLLFAPTQLLPRYFARWRLADVMLDTFPFGAHTTVNDALFAGVPVITQAGRSFASRASASQLVAAGLPELVATDAGSYEALALALATDAPRRAALAHRLRDGRDKGALFDMDRHAATFAAALTAAWRERF